MTLSLAGIFAPVTTPFVAGGDIDVGYGGARSVSGDGGEVVIFARAG